EIPVDALPSAGHSGQGRAAASPAQVLVEPGLALEPLDVADAEVAVPAEVLGGHAVAGERGHQLLHAAPHGPLRLVFRERRLELAAIDAVAPRVRPGTFRVPDPAAGHELLDDVRDLADPVVLARPPDVERLVVDPLAWRVQDRDEGAREVLDVDQRPPRRPIALDQDL